MLISIRNALPVVLSAACIVLGGCAAETGEEVVTPTARAETRAPRRPEAASGPAVANVEVPAGFLDAAAAGNSGAVIGAIDSGVDADVTNDQGSTALMLASFNGHDALVRELLTRGAFVGKADNLGRTAVMYASSGPYPDTVRLLLENGAEVNRTESSEGWTALMFAAGEGQVDVIKALLDGGADPTLTDDDGDAATNHARRNGHEAAAGLLEDAETGATR